MMQDQLHEPVVEFRNCRRAQTACRLPRLEVMADAFLSEMMDIEAECLAAERRVER